MFMHRKGTFSSENTCEAFISAGVCIGHKIASLALCLSHPSISCHYLQPQGFDAHSTRSTPRWSSLPRNNTQLSKDTSGQSQQPKDVGLPSCLTHPYTCTVVHRRACNSNRIGNMPQSKNDNFASGKGPTYLH